jgi:hypothetical protein
VPTHFHGITGLEKSVLTKISQASLDYYLHAAALPQTTKEKIVEIFGNHVFMKHMGSTEGGYVSNLRPPDH